VFSTAEDNQNTVTIRILQGECEMAANKLLSQFGLIAIRRGRAARRRSGCRSPSIANPGLQGDGWGNC
jgi:molecular chaperone DnaK (HSP70)